MREDISRSEAGKPNRRVFCPVGSWLRRTLAQRRIDLRKATLLVTEDHHEEFAEQLLDSRIGRTGSGKSTLIQVLLHLYPTQGGETRIGGVKLAERYGEPVA